VDETSLVLKKLVLENGKAVGAFLVNAPDKKELFQGAVEGRVSLAEIGPEFIAAERASQGEAIA
jgi:hypothetical protein